MFKKILAKIRECFSFKIVLKPTITTITFTGSCSTPIDTLSVHNLSFSSIYLNCK